MRYFTQGRLREYEKLMQKPPRYYHYEPKLPDIPEIYACEYCLYYEKKKCTLVKCCIEQRTHR